MIRIVAGVSAFILIGLPRPALAYSVLTHEAIIDTLWIDTIQTGLIRRFPGATEEQLREAHAHAYGGCIIQDLGYYPFGNHLFSDLVHYVRSADFLQALLDESRDLNEYAFALGAVAHYGADVEGHSRAVNRAVPVLFPALRKRFGDEVTYADDPAAHLKTEFGFDVLQVARGHYAPKAYHDFIGFQVSKDLLDRAFEKTYGLHLKDLFRTLDLALGTYRYSVSKMVPNLTKTAWSIKSDEIQRDQPTVSRKQFLYNMKRASFEQEWGATYDRPHLGARVLALLFRLVPKVGPFKGLAFKVPTPQTERMFEDSFDAAVTRDRESFAEAKAGDLKISNRDLDTGKPVKPGEYLLTDITYDKLLVKLAEKKFAGVTPELRANILGFYASMKTPDIHGIGPQLNALKAFAPPAN
ncbi:MAG TPA: zinc dependent phospholipase C family protein [Bryobacteraceae bacterium]|nr:zinc dependent phospholipase C family protein [Bryobacteraceae bacterium]